MLYVQLEGLWNEDDDRERAQRRAAACERRVARRTARRAAARAALSSGSDWLQSLLQPWQSFVLYQEEQADGELLAVAGKEQ
jgi:hypothetical protein